jgi:hypothetical protein
MRTRMHARASTCTEAHEHACTARARTHAHALPHTRTEPHMHACTRTRVHRQKHMHAGTHRGSGTGTGWGRERDRQTATQRVHLSCTSALISRSLRRRWHIVGPTCRKHVVETTQRGCPRESCEVNGRGSDARNRPEGEKTVPGVCPHSLYYAAQRPATNCGLPTCSSPALGRQ